MFRYLAILGFIVTAAAIVLHGTLRRPKLCAASTARPQIGGIAKLIYALAFLCLLCMSATGLPGAIFNGPGSLGGLKLFFHMAVAPGFITFLIALLFVFGERNTFGQRLVESSRGGVVVQFNFLARVVFWWVAVSGFVAIASVVASMAPIFPSEAQHAMLRIHRCAALACLCSMLLHAYTLSLPGQTVQCDEPAPASAHDAVAASH